MNNRFIRGFSIVEMSIVLVIVGTILTFSIDYLSQSATQSALNKTTQKLDKIETALKNYVDINGYLPCPAVSDAATASSTYGIPTDCAGAAPSGTTVENSAVENLDIRIGAIPTRALGLSDQDMLDSWGNRFTYAVVENLAIDATTFKDFSTREITGVIQVTDANGYQLTQLSPSGTCDGSVADDTCPVVAYVIVSHGKDERGAYNRDGSNDYEACGSAKLDSANCDGDEVFISTFINDGEVDQYYFDDLIRWKEIAQTMSPQFMSAKVNLPPPYFMFKTTSSDATFNPTSISYLSSDLVWTCTNCVTETTGTGNTPNLDLSAGGNPSEKEVKVTSASNFSNLTLLGMNSLQITDFLYEMDGSLSDLTRLFLYSNNLTSLNTNIGNLSSLKELRAHINDFTSLPEELGDLNSLNILLLGSNSVDLDSLPTGMFDPGDLPNLTKLQVNNMGLNSIPSGIGNLTTLTTLFIYGNDLAEIPTTIGNLTALTDLRAHQNDFTSLPEELGDLTSLNILFLGSNSVDLDSLPTGMFDSGDLPNLTQLQLNNMGLNSIPSGIENLTTLTTLLIYGNDLTEVPTGINDITTLTDFRMYSNELTSANFDTYITDLHSNRATNVCSATSTDIYYNATVLATGQSISVDAYSRIKGTCAYSGIGLNSTSCDITLTYSDPGC